MTSPPKRVMAADWLNAMDGVAYLVASGGEVLAVGERGWNAFRESAGQAQPEAEAVIGRTLFSMMEDEAVRAAFASLHRRVASLAVPALAYEYRCDAPSCERFMKMALGAVISEGRLVGVLYQSTLVASKDRVPLPFLDVAASLRAEESRAGVPLVRICQFCAKVAAEAWNGEWIEPATYYRRGGADDVRLSHGICPDCDRSRLQPLLGPALPSPGSPG